MQGSIGWEGNGNPLQYSCLEKPWRRRSLVGHSPWGREELDTTEQLHFHFSLSCTGEGHGNPLQCSCLENPRDRGAWWAAIYWVAQSQTWLTRLSSINSTFKLDLKKSQSGINHLWDGDTYWWVVTLQPSSIGPFITVKRQKENCKRSQYKTWVSLPCGQGGQGTEKTWYICPCQPFQF